MKKTVVLLLVLGCLAGMGARLMLRDDPRAELRNRPSSGVYHSGDLAANGVVEGARPEVALRPEVEAGREGSGRLVCHAQAPPNLCQG
jgi:hypothetical protein